MVHTSLGLLLTKKDKKTLHRHSRAFTFRAGPSREKKAELQRPRLAPPGRPGVELGVAAGGRPLLAPPPLAGAVPFVRRAGQQ